MDNPPPMIASLDHLVLTVTDIMATVAFYRDILGMQALQFEAADGSRRWALAFGAQKINLHPGTGPFYAPCRRAACRVVGSVLFVANPAGRVGCISSRPVVKRC